MKCIRILVIAVLCALMAGIGVTKPDNLIWQVVTIIATGFVGAVIASFYESLNTYGQKFNTWFQSMITHRNKEIYLSFSYIYRIEIDGKYLLVRGRRMKDRYQPIGGVYKFYEEAKPFLNSIKFQPDTMVGNTDETGTTVTYHPDKQNSDQRKASSCIYGLVFENGRTGIRT